MSYYRDRSLGYGFYLRTYGSSALQFHRVAAALFHQSAGIENRVIY